jgi:hypothetical protein
VDRLAVHRAIDTILDAIEERATVATPPIDDLVPLTLKAVEARGLELRPLVRLAEAGTLKTVRIGRRRYTRASWLAGLADALPPAADVEPADELTAAARRRAARRVA